MKFILAILILAIIPQAGWSKEKAKSVDEELRLKANDEEGNELRSLKAELLISKSDEKALQQLKKLLRRYSGTPMEASIHFRLAELYTRRARTANFFELNRDKSNIVQFSPTATKSTTSRSWVTKAVDVYDMIERKFTHFRDMDMVLFNSAFSRQILGQEKEAIQRYQKIVSNYQESSLIPDAHLAIGESYFGFKDFQRAYDEFQNIRKYPDARVFPYGLYKGAWSLYNMRKSPEAMKQLEEVVAYAKENNEDTNRLDLTREALDDMVVFYEDVKQPHEAVSYFRKQGGDHRAGDLVLKLGKVYQRHGRHKNLEIVYNDLIDAVPKAPERPDIHRDLMDAYENTNRPLKSIEQLEVLSDLCVEKGSWAKNQKPEAVKQCWEQLEDSGKIYAAKWHKKLKKNQTPELVQVTRRAYEALLKHNQKIPEEDKFRFSYAELLFQETQYRKASVEYSRVAHISKDAKLIHDGAYGALVSLEKAAGDKWSDEDERKFAQLATDYVTLNPKGAYTTDVKFKKAFIAYDKGRLDEAAPQLKDLALKFGTTERGLKAANIYLDILNLQKKFESLRDESKMFLTKLKLDEKTRAQFVKINQQASFTVIQNLESQGKYKDAVAGYLKFVKEDPHSQFADKALYNAIRCANLAGDLSGAAKISEQVFIQYPNSTYRNELATALVTLYEAQAQLGLTARTYLRLAEWEPSKKWSYTLAAADYKALNNEWTDATKIYSEIMTKAPQSSEAKVSLERLAALAERNKQESKANHFYTLLIDSQVQPQASLALAKLTQKAYDEKDEEKAFRLAKKVISMRGEKKVSIFALAQARMVQARILEKEFEQASVKARPDKLSIVLSIKTEKLERTQRAYQDVIAFGDKSLAIDALVRLAKCYEKYAAALKSIEAPADASEADKNKFISEMENLALPIEEKNAETLQLALKQARDLRHHDGKVATIQMELNRLARKNVNLTPDLAAPGNVLPLVN